MDSPDYVIKKGNEEYEMQNTNTASDNIPIVCELLTKLTPVDESENANNNSHDKKIAIESEKTNSPATADSSLISEQVWSDGDSWMIMSDFDASSEDKISIEKKESKNLLPAVSNYLDCQNGGQITQENMNENNNQNSVVVEETDMETFSKTVAQKIVYDSIDLENDLYSKNIVSGLLQSWPDNNIEIQTSKNDDERYNDETESQMNYSLSSSPEYKMDVDHEEKSMPGLINIKQLNTEKRLLKYYPMAHKESQIEAGQDDISIENDSTTVLDKQLFLSRFGKVKLSKDPVFVSSSKKLKSELNETEVFGNMESECLITGTLPCDTEQPPESENDNFSLDTTNMSELQLSDIEEDMSSVSNMSIALSENSSFNISFEEVNVVETRLFNDEIYEIEYVESDSVEQIALNQLQELERESSVNVMRQFNQAETLQQNSELSNYETEVLFSYIVQENEEVEDFGEALQTQQKLLMMYNQNKEKSNNSDKNGQRIKQKFSTRFDNTCQEFPSTSKKIKIGTEEHPIVLESSPITLVSGDDNLSYCYEIPSASMEQNVSPSRITSFIVNDDGTLMSCDEKENSNEISYDIDSVDIGALSLEELDELIATNKIIIEKLEEINTEISYEVTSQFDQTEVVEQNADLGNNNEETLYLNGDDEENDEKHTSFEKSLQVKKKLPMMHKPNRQLNDNSQKTYQENKPKIKNTSVPGSKSVSTNRNNSKCKGNIISDAKKYSFLESDLELSENTPLAINEQVSSAERVFSQQFYTTPIANELDDSSKSNSSIEMPSGSVSKKRNKTMKNEHKCHRCGFVFATLVEYCYHVSMCDARSENRYCNKCQYLFRSGEILQQHNIDYHMRKNGNQFDRERQLNHDSNSGGEIKEGNCSVCDALFFYRSSKGSKKSKWICQMCSNVISESGSYV